MRVVEDVARILAPRIFTLDEETPLGMGKDVMVVSPKGVTVREDEDVEVVGVVREFTWTELEKEKFDFDLKREWQTEFKSRPVIYATSVRAGEDLLTTEAGPSRRRGAHPSCAAPRMFQASRSGSITFSTTFPPSTLT